MSNEMDGLVPEDAARAVAEAIPMHRIVDAIRKDYRANVGDDEQVPGLIVEAVIVAAPFIAAAELESMADGLCCGHVLWDRAAELRKVAEGTPEARP